MDPTNVHTRRKLLALTGTSIAAAVSGCGSPDETTPTASATGTTESTPTDTTESTPTDTTEPTPSGPATPLNGDIEQRGAIALASPAFDDGERMPDYVGRANDDVNPELTVEGVPDGTSSLVLALDDPDAQPVTGHTWNHWLVWNVDSDIGTVAREWAPETAVEGYNDFGQRGYGGPAPPSGSHRYRFKLLALDSTLSMPAETRKSRLGSAISFNADVLAATQLVGRFHADQ